MRSTLIAELKGTNDEQREGRELELGKKGSMDSVWLVDLYQKLANIGDKFL